MIQKNTTRKKFIWSSFIGMVTLSPLLLLFKSKNNNNPAENKQKFLTQNGDLVEVDINKIISKESKKITNQELQNWVHKK